MLDNTPTVEQVEEALAGRTVLIAFGDDVYAKLYYRSGKLVLYLIPESEYNKDNAESGL